MIAGVTALATVTIRLGMAILPGTIFSLVVYLHCTSRPYVRLMGFDEPVDAGGEMGSEGGDRPFVVHAEAAVLLPECP